MNYLAKYSRSLSILKCCSTSFIFLLNQPFFKLLNASFLCFKMNTHTFLVKSSITVMKYFPSSGMVHHDIDQFNECRFQFWVHNNFACNKHIKFASTLHNFRSSEWSMLFYYIFGVQI